MPCPPCSGNRVLIVHLVLILFASLTVAALFARAATAQDVVARGDGALEPASSRFTPRWTAMASGPPLPAGRHVHTLTYDVAGDRAILFGGFAGGAPFSDVWMLTLGENAAWTQIFPTGAAPTGRRGHSSIYDSARGRVVVFGGYDGAYRNDTWQLSLGAAPAWTPLATTGNPPLSYWHSAIYDPARDAMVVFAGNGGATGIRNDVWVLSFATMNWEQMMPAGILPAPRFGHSAVFDPTTERMIVFGGHRDGVGFRNDAWALSLTDAAWSELNADVAPAPREGAPAIHDPVEKRLVVFGGWDGSTTRNDTWALATSSSEWTELPLSGLPPIRSGAASIYDPLRDRMVVFGGNSSSARNDTWSLRWPARPVLAGSESPPVEGALAASPPNVALDAARPNPFTRFTTIRFTLTAPSPVRLEVFDASGRRVRTLARGILPAGVQEATWPGDDDAGRAVAAGAYFFRLVTAGEHGATRPVRLIR